MALLWLMVGGVAGTLARYAMGAALTPRLLGVVPGSPWALVGATLLVNVCGAFVLGYVSSLSQDWLAPHWRLGLGAGFCGAFTTFSTLSLELVVLWSAGHHGTAAAYWLLSSAGGLGAVLLGQQVARSWH